MNAPAPLRIALETTGELDGQPFPIRLWADPVARTLEVESPVRAGERPLRLFVAFPRAGSRDRLEVTVYDTGLDADDERDLERRLAEALGPVFARALAAGSTFPF